MKWNSSSSLYTSAETNMTFDKVIKGKDNIYDCFRRVLREEIDRSGKGIDGACTFAGRSNGWLNNFLAKRAESITLGDFFLCCEYYGVEASWFFDAYKEGIFSKDGMQ